jgi:pyruvate,water dikinase
VVKTQADILGFEIGDILVAAETDIAFVPAMQKAAAVITETGGRFCHAAVWARENQKPTILQVPNATSLLGAADFVIVDADSGSVEWEA